VIDGAKGNTIELRGESFSSAGVQLNGQFKGANRFLKECSLLALRLGEGHGDLRAAESDGDAGETGTGPEVEESRNSRRKVSGASNGLNEVTLDNTCGIADCGQVYLGVPAQNEGKVSLEFDQLSSIERRQMSVRKRFIYLATY